MLYTYKIDLERFFCSGGWVLQEFCCQGGRLGEGKKLWWGGPLGTAVRTAARLHQAVNLYGKHRKRF